jgi:hypothetical protein
MSKTKYLSCDVQGKGTLNNDLHFRIIELSAEHIRIRTDAPIKIDSQVHLDFSLDGGLFVIKVSCNGIVSRVVENGYQIDFTDIADNDKIEINELMKSSCDII